MHHVQEVSCCVACVCRSSAAPSFTMGSWWIPEDGRMMLMSPQSTPVENSPSILPWGQAEVHCVKLILNWVDFCFVNLVQGIC